MPSLKFTTPDMRMTIEVTGDNNREVFEELVSMLEVFSNTTCGACRSNDTKPVIRTVKDSAGKPATYHEMRCNACKAVLALSVHNTKEQTLYPKRKGKDGQWLPGDGWVKYEGGGQGQRAPRQERTYDEGEAF